MIGKIFSHSLIYGIAPQIPRLASFFILPYITPFLTENDYGIYGLLMSYTLILSTIKDFGLTIVLSNTFIKNPSNYKQLWGQLYGFLFIWNFIFALILIIVLYFVIPIEAQNNRWLLIGLNTLPYIFFGQTTNIGQTYYQLTKQPFEIAIRASMIGLFAIGINFYTIAILKLGYLGFFWAIFFSTMLYNISYWIPLHYKIKIKPIFILDKAFIKKSVQTGSPIIPHALAANFQNVSDRIVMENYKISTANIGNISFAYNFGNLFATIAQATNTAIGPYLLEYYHTKKDLYARNLIFIWQIGLLFIAFISSLWLKEIFKIIIKNDSLSKLYPFAIILIMAQCYRPMYVGSLQKLFYVEKTIHLFKVTLTACIVNLILNILFIPKFGYTFTLYSSYIAFLIQGYLFYFFKIYKEITPVKFYPLFWFVIHIAGTILVYFLKDISLYLKVIISGVVLLVSVFSILKIYNYDYNHKL